MKVAIIGYGKMGRMIHQILRERGHEVSVIIDEHNQEEFASRAFASSDVAIEFTRPTSAVGDILGCFAAGVPVVCGTTGWTDALPELRDMCAKGKGTLLWSSNFSIGMNIFMALNRYLTSVMSKFPAYTPSMEEIHHIHKLDHPSGTAITLAEELVANDPAVSGWEEVEEPAEVKDGRVLPIVARREGEVPGVHSICWESEADTVTITHSAKSRMGFALGAVLAAEWLSSRKGFHTMSEMLSDYTETTGIFS
ncbi:MAG: 4-hydroxy-tetrahydrodipicolinate reductase [Bacteroides sp.]|nr:4-hydroxy-tetrahydrodipicolinate reductase [Bacteroides sp.]